MIITFGHTKGGVGKSLLAWHTAVALNVPVVDLDFQKTMVFSNSLRRQAGLKPLDIIHINSDDQFIKMFEDWPDDKDIIIDVGGFDMSINRIALIISDIVITPAIDRVTEMAGLSKFHEIISDISRKMNVNVRTKVLLNDISPSAKDFSDFIEMVDSFDRYDRLNSVIRHRADFYNAMKEGKGVTEYTTSKAKDELLVLLKEIKRIGMDNG
jgi:chromosome partitioning protein